MQREESSLPFVAVGVLLALVLIVVTFRSSPPNESVLSRRFAPQPVDPLKPTLSPFELPQVSLPDLPPDAQTRISDLTEQLAGGRSIPALTPVATGPGLRVSVEALRRSGERVSVRGTLANTGQSPIRVAPESFLFRDSAGVSYTTEGSGSTQLAPGETTSFDLSIPLPAQRGLTLIVDIPPEPPLEQTLIVELR
jgi:hypothetical protein